MKKRMALLVSAALTLSACGESSGPGTSAKRNTAAKINLHVFTDEGPVTRGKVEIKDAQGTVVTKADLNGDSATAVTVPGGTSYPVVVWAFPEGEAEPMKAAVTSDLVAEQDVSPVTTIVVDSAMSLGGLTEQNLAKAAGAAISQRRSSGGKGSSSGFKGDPTKQYGGWH